MDKLEYKTLTLDDDIGKLLRKTKQFSGVTLPKSYIENSKVVGFFLHDNLVAGYMLVSGPKFRSLHFVPDCIKYANPFFLKDTYEMLEVNALWISHALKCPKQKLRIWNRLQWDILASRKKYLLLLSDSKNKAIERIHMLADPNLIYEGAPNLMAGETSHDEIRVAYTTRWKVATSIVKMWYERRSRSRRLADSLVQKTLVST